MPKEPTRLAVAATAVAAFATVLALGHLFVWVVGR